MEKFLKVALIASSVLFIGQNLAKAADFTVTHKPLYGGGWQSTYRAIEPRPDRYADEGGTVVLQGEAPANGCDTDGIGGFETVTRLYPGEKRCNGAAPRR